VGDSTPIDSLALSKYKFGLVTFLVTNYLILFYILTTLVEVDPLKLEI
jgi:hypothetical protein